MQIKEDYYYPTIESFYFPTSTFNHFWDAVDAFSKVYIIDDFIRKVKPEGPWDIKLRDAWEATIGTKFPGQNTTVIYHGQKTTAHELGNYTYGVIGRAYGFPVDVLILGSFVAAGLPLYGNDLTNELSDWPFIKAGFYAGGAFYE